MRRYSINTSDIVILFPQAITMAEEPDTTIDCYLVLISGETKVRIVLCVVVGLRDFIY